MRKFFVGIAAAALTLVGVAGTPSTAEAAPRHKGRYYGSHYHRGHYVSPDRWGRGWGYRPGWYSGYGYRPYRGYYGPYSYAYRPFYGHYGPYSYGYPGYSFGFQGPGFGFWIGR